MANPTEVPQEQRTLLACNHKYGQVTATGRETICRNIVSYSPALLRIPLELGLGKEEYAILRSAQRHPPVTKEILSELDMSYLINNLEFLLDLNFCRDIQLQPNLHGDDGRRKLEAAANYWRAMQIEITIYMFYAPKYWGELSADALIDQEQSFQPRLPSLFDTLRDVLKTLTAEHYHPLVMQSFDVPLLTQQIQKGVLDMIKVAKWLASLLKTHCAPSRDESVDRMVEEISEASDNSDPDLIARGLQRLFQILEEMKLDVANLMVRRSRTFLIERSILFARHLCQNIEEQNYRTSLLRFYQPLLESSLCETEKLNVRLPSLFIGAVSDRLLQFKPPECFPEPFSSHLWQLWEILQRLIALDICRKLCQAYVASRGRLQLCDEEYLALRGRLEVLMDKEDGRQWSHARESIRPIALEIAKSACHPDEPPENIVVQIEDELRNNLSAGSRLSHHIQDLWRSKLIAAAEGCAKEYRAMALDAIAQSQNRHPASLGDHSIEEVAIRLAHICILSCRIWEPILQERFGSPGCCTEQPLPPNTA